MPEDDGHDGFASPPGPARRPADRVALRTDSRSAVPEATAAAVRPARRAERLGTPGRSPGGSLPGWTLRAAGGVVAAPVVVGVLAVVVSGHDGGRERPAEAPVSSPHPKEAE